MARAERAGAGIARAGDGDGGGHHPLHGAGAQGMGSKTVSGHAGGDGRGATWLSTPGRPRARERVPAGVADDT